MISRLLYLMIIGVLLFTVDGLGQNTWVKTYGGSGYDRGNSIVSTFDGGYVLSGMTSANNGDFSVKWDKGEDVFVMKINSSGEIEWKRTFGGDKEDVGYSITNIKDGGYILTGQKGMTSLYGTLSRDIFVMKLNSRGEIVWEKKFGGNDNEYGRSVTPTTDGGCVLTGETSSNDGDFGGMNKGGGDIFVVKLNSSGDIVWKKTFGGSGVDEGNSITNTNDGGYILTGYTSSNDGDFRGMAKGNGDIFVLKLNSNGDLVWKKSFGGSDGVEYGNSITTTTDSGYVLTGRTNSYDGDFRGMAKGNGDIFVLKLNSSGDIVWKRTFGSRSFEEGLSITTTTQGEYVLTGVVDVDRISGLPGFNNGDFKEMVIGGEDIFVIKLNSSGDIIFKKVFGGKSSESGSSIITSIDGGYVLTGYTGSNDGDFIDINKGFYDIFVMKLDKNGNLNKK